MNRQEWEELVWKTDFNPTATAICVAIGSHGNWTNERTVRPSRQRIAGMVGTSRGNVGDYMDALEAQGFLKVVEVTKNNVKVYELCDPQVVVVTGILAKKKRGKSINQVAVVPDNLDNQVVVDDELGCRSSRQEVVVVKDEVVVVPDTNLKNLQDMNLEEPTRSTTDKSAVHLDEDEQLGEVAVFNRVDQVNSYIEGIRYLSLTSEQKTQIRELALNPQWYGTESRPNYRTQAAIKEVLDNERVQV